MEQEQDLQAVNQHELSDLETILDTPDRGLLDAFQKAANDAVAAIRNGGSLVELMQVAKTLSGDPDVRVTARVAKLIAAELGGTAIVALLGNPMALLAQAIVLGPKIAKIVAEEKALRED